MVRLAVAAVGSIAGIAALSFCVGTPVALAYTDAESAYIAQVQGGGVNGDPADIVRTGHMVCDLSTQGNSIDAMANTLQTGSVMRNGSDAITTDQAYGVVNAAITTLCPPAGGQVSAQPAQTSPGGGPDCQKLADDYAAVPPGTTDALEYLKAMPGLKWVEPGSLAACGIGAVASDPASIGNNQQAFTGFCRGVEALAPFDLAHNFVCGTPAG